MSDYIIQTQGLTKQYGARKAVNEVTLNIRRGDIYGFLGPNGAGKTTTIRMLLGLIRPSRGRIHIFGKELPKHRMSILKKVGSLVEYPSYYGHLTGYENLEAIRRILDVPKSRIDEVLSIVRLTQDAKRPVKGYSLGMKQRLGIACALLGQPELLILDEPTNGLDPSGILEIRELIKSMPQQHGITVLVSSHLLSEVEQMANRVGIIQHGEMVFQDTIDSLHNRAQHRIQIAVSNPEQAFRTLASSGCSAEFNEESLVLDYMPDNKVAAIVELLVRNSHSVYRVEEKRQSLEEMFLALTGEGSRQ
ncbi:ABC transporter ATP-binding protein [Paenibacillus apiarius]|uniref:ABC transporter ATP-binding protein n=1 Tax=Paenibacillus apiarius TaxID=46240 RepID=A0ABT4DQX9_9BACL|nr:ABC transporter ATP-binding protein [Paenibacillus apiarius]MCY9516220.1 ABC transporter ATP-binding protein [Paenibacillus apiarius]MCY9519754.1 ABC transporter ATP-binding protein [Paenibacillus apiarius]MCY9555280.1 ABC transporter ATP-binding protein [Paenibacillus apiarius]MCY9559361.1 ABC transporter ATP-binding protein [Paenibacillus apiarius]MCY9682720.1 ABC transporter ATP-binding protein [Paenibacillus apiarius]